MTTRIELHNTLVSILGSNQVYYQPPANVKMHYPAIVYSKEKPSAVQAGNRMYKWNDCFTVVVISKDPDNDFAKQICKAISMASPGKRYIAENLYHDPITIYL